MATASREFVDGILEIMPQLHQTYDELISEFSPNEPPITVLLGGFGLEIGTSSELFDERLFTFIESGLVSPDQSLANAVATGLLEALYNSARQNGRVNQVIPQLGVQSLRYLQEWTAE